MPKQIKQDNLAFNRVVSCDKIPIDKGWQKNNNFKYNDPELQKHIKNKGNYGVLCGIGDLVVLDADDLDFVCVINDLESRNVLPKTLTVQTAKGFHYYYKSKFPERKIILEKGEKHVGEILSNGCFVIGPNSIHPSGAKYSVVRDLEIAELKDDELMEFEPWFKSELSHEKVDIKGDGSWSSKVNQKLSILNIARSYGFEVRGNKAVCKFHNDTKPSLTFVDENGLFLCYGCNLKGNITTFVSLCKEHKFERNEEIKWSRK
ncbi:bifunctional DNA primase/polymerase [archaeon]|nr:bifunctional DNA primase/polymerase [archaeon]